MPTNRREELLTVLQEECAEVIQAASKQLRFGVNARNKESLITEIGDVMGMLKMLLDESYLDADAIQAAAERKIIKVEKNMTFKKVEIDEKV